MVAGEALVEPRLSAVPDRSPRNQTMFRKVELQVSTGEFVHRGWMPAFQNGLPDVVFWGTRVFQRHSASDQDDPLIYRECFSYALVELPGAPEP